MGCFEKIFNEYERKKNKSMDKYVKDEAFKKSIYKSEVIVCFITKNFVKDKHRIEHCDIACKKNKVMYAAVKKGTRWNKFKKYPWRKIVYFETEDELKATIRYFYKDYMWIKTSGGV